MTTDQVHANDESPKPKQSGIDACWNVPVLAALASCFASIGMTNSGFFFVGIMEELDTDRKKASLPRTVMGVMITLSGTIFWVLRRWLSLFQIILLGSIITWTGLIAAAFSPNMAWLTICYGGLYGVGLGINILSMGMLITIYFDKYRGIASGIRYVGLSLSTLIFPPILPYAQNEYGFRGTLFLCGAMTMNTTAFTFALKEPRRKRRSLVLAPISDSLQRASSQRKENQRSSFGLLRKPTFYAINMSFVFFDYLSVSFQTSLVDYALDKGISLSKAETIIAYMTIPQLLGCLAIPLIADKGYMSRSTLVMINFFLLGCSLMVLPHCSTFVSLLISCLCAETFFSLVLLMREVLMADYFGIENIPTCTAIGGLASLPLILCGPAIIGVFRDSMGTYDNYYRLLAALQYFASGLFLGIFCWDQTRKSTWTP